MDSNERRQWRTKMDDEDLPPILLVLSNSDDQIIYFYVMSMVWYEWYGMV